MATATGRGEVAAYMAAIRAGIEDKLLPGAVRAGAKVVAAEIKDRAQSEEVAKAVVISRPKRDGDQIAVHITIKDGWAYSLAVWQEWGTSQHIISADESERNGMSIRKINEAHKAGSLVIGGNFAGPSVVHPGARSEPFVRVSLDLKEREAVAAMQSYINSHVTPSGIIGSSDEGGEA